MASPTVTTNVPAPSFGAAGFIAPPESDILAGVLADFQKAFGGGLNTQLATPQGQLASSETAIIGQVNDTFLLYQNQVDPAFSSGRMQDAIARIYFLTRFPAQGTSVQATCSGIAGTVIPIGVLAEATDGNLYGSLVAGIIGAGGTVVIPFSAINPGPIACPSHTLTKIFSTIPGWSSIDNTQDGIIGSDAETRSAFETRRAASVAGNATGALPSIVGAILQLPGILSVYATENVTGGTLTVGGVVLAAHSIYVAVEGGLPAQIAATLWGRKAPGCNYNGNTTITVYDTNSGYQPPLPSYAVQYTIPNDLQIVFAVQIQNGPTVPSNSYAQVQGAIDSAFVGADGQPRPQIGAPVLASRFIAGIKGLGSWANNVISVSVGSSNDAAAPDFTGQIAVGVSGGTLTVTSLTGGTLSAGMFVIDGSGVVLDGTSITRQISGTPGSNGSYAVSLSQICGPFSMTAVLPQLSQTTVNIDQIPTFSDGNLTLTLV